MCARCGWLRHGLLLLLLLLQRLVVVLRVEVLHVFQDNLHPRKEVAVVSDPLVTPLVTPQVTPRAQAPKEAAVELTITLPRCQEL